MRSSSATAPLLVLLLLAGCLAPGPSGDAPRAGAQPPAYAPDCSIATAGWAQGCAARASSTAGSKTELWAAVNPTDPRNVVLGAKDLNPDSTPNCVWNGLFVTKDGGRTWRDVVIGGRYADRGPTSPFFGYACNTDPMFAFAPDGTLFFNVELYEFGGEATRETPGTREFTNRSQLGSKLLLAASFDGGLTWPRLALQDVGDGPIVFHDYSRMAVSPVTGTVFTFINTFTDAGAFGSVLASRDGARTVAPPVKVTPREDPGSAFSTGVAVAPSGRVVVAQTAGFSPIASGNPGILYVAHSDDDGRSFTNPREVLRYSAMDPRLANVQFRAGTFVQIAYDLSSGPHAGRLYAAWADAAGPAARIVVASSDDDGLTWSAPVPVKNGTRAHDQFHPSLVVDDRGDVHVAFFDREFDPQNKLLDVTHAWSQDGGATWSHHRLTTRSFDGDLGVHQDGFPFIGDYLGLAAAGDDVWIGYPDTTSGEAVAAAIRVVRS
ncbi:MAG TPA: exo-alpha-sialidase [Candidatus Thermoplasmatota archaeon]|nr:exo-alpha-sialidase [Candidatus Thermoplasmatota archaeon]